MQYLIGADIGTSSAKTVLFDRAGTPVSSYTCEYEVCQPRNGWAEQDPEDWWKGFCAGVRAVLSESGVAPEDILGIGLSGQMHGLVMLDEDGKPLRRSIIWCDQRTGAEAEWMTERIGREKLVQITGNPAITGFTAAKLLWVKRHEPELYARCRHILLPKDYIRLRLCGVYASDVSDASGMQLMDIRERCWSEEICSLLGVDMALLPKLYESQDKTGEVTEDAAAETGLHAGTLVCGGAGDNPASAIGTGVFEEGRAFTTIGTSAVTYAVSDEIRIDPGGRVHSLCASVPGKWTVMSCTQAAGLSLRWLRDTICAEEKREAERTGADAYDIMTREAETVPIGAGQLIYEPYLMGERSPHLDPDCRGTFIGLSAGHTRANLIRAVMEGISYSQRECVDIFREMGVRIDDMLVCGGGARNPFWRQMLCDLYDCPVSTLRSGQGGALGAAILAGVAAGMYPSIAEACTRMIRKQDTVRPIAAHTRAYEPYYRIYRKLYGTLRETFRELAEERKKTEKTEKTEKIEKTEK